MYNIGILLAVDSKAAGIFLKKSATANKNAERGVFAGIPIGAGDILGYYFRSLLYSDLGTQKQLKKTYGECVIIETMEKFLKWALKIQDTIVNGTVSERISWIVPTPFWCTWHSNDAKYLPREKATHMVKILHTKQNNVPIVQMFSP